MSCKITNSYLSYVKASRPEFMVPLPQDLPHDEHYLMDPDNWISWDIERILEDRLVKLYNDEMIMFRIGQSVVSYKSLGMLIIKSVNDCICEYGHSFGYEHICTCPTRIGIYAEYKK